MLEHRDVIFYSLFKGQISLNVTQHSDALRQRELSAQFIDSPNSLITVVLIYFHVRCH